MDISDVFVSDKWTRPEKEVVAWQFNLIGDFKKHLWEAISRADHKNIEKLRRGFPELIEGYEMWSSGDLGTRLRRAGLDI